MTAPGDEAAPTLPTAPPRQPASGRLRPQDRTALHLLANNALIAGAGLAFWLILVRLGHVSPAEVGRGSATIAIATLVAVLAKGGLDTAMLRTPGNDLGALLRLALLAGGLAAVAAVAATAALDAAWGLEATLQAADWVLAAGIAVLLVASWLQDARFVAAGASHFAVQRTVALAVARLALPWAAIALAWPHPVALTWLLGLAVSTAWAGFLAARLRRGVASGGSPRGDAGTRAFMQSALRNLPSSAAEFLPGLLLTPIVLAASGPEPAAHFAMAWTAASLLFLAAGALARSALARLGAGDPAQPTLRRAALQMAAVLVPAAAAGALLAPWIMGLLGAEYRDAATTPFRVLCLSILAVAPATLLWTQLRATERTLPLAAWPLVLVALLLLLAPPLAARWGATGVAVAWTVANLPLAAAAATALARTPKEVSHAAPLGRGAHVE